MPNSGSIYLPTNVEKDFSGSTVSTSADLMKRAERAATKLRAAAKRTVNEERQKVEIDAKRFAEDRVKV